MKQIMIANPRGFCAGVDRAILIVNRALELFGAPVYVRHEVVHNRYVVEELRQKGAIFVEQLSDVPVGSTLIFSAHGVPQAVEVEAEQRQLQVFDATCPLVTKVHMEVARHAAKNENVVMIGHAGHPEVEGTLGRYHSEQGAIALVETVQDVTGLTFPLDQPLYYVTQTTLSMDDTNAVVIALQQQYPLLQGQKKDDICYATQNRQDEVKRLTASCDALLVVGSPNSSNSNRLREVAQRQGVDAYLIDSAEEILPQWFETKSTVGLTAGASAPESLVKQVVSRLEQLGFTLNGSMEEESEGITFVLPKALR